MGLALAPVRVLQPQTNLATFDIPLKVYTELKSGVSIM